MLQSCEFDDNRRHGIGFDPKSDGIQRQTAMIIPDGEKLLICGDELGEYGLNEAVCANPFGIRHHSSIDTFGHCDPLAIGFYSSRRGHKRTQETMQRDNVTTACSGKKRLDLKRSPIVLAIELETLIDSGLLIRNNDNNHLVVEYESDGITGSINLIESEFLLYRECLLGDADTRRIDRAIGNITGLAGT